MVIQQTKHYQEEIYSGKTSILIVDDDPDVLASIKDVVALEMQDCLVEVASNVEQAMLLAQQVKPDIALLDIKLGQDSGLDLIPDLKAICSDIAIIMMTAFRENKYTVEAVRFGANDYLYKPVNPNELIQTITRLLQHQKINREKVNAERRFYTLFEQSTQWLFLLSNEGLLIDVNKTAMDTITEEKLSVLGRSFCDCPWYVSSLNAKKLIQTGLSEVKEGKLFNTELNVVTADQKERIFDSYMKPVFDDKHNVCQIIVECRDITKRKKAEEEIKLLNETLGVRVKERTLELEQSMLQLKEENKERKKAEQKAHQASEAKSEFLSRMSHELRTPLNAIIGFGQLLGLDSDKLSENQQYNVKHIVDAGHHLLNLINDVLDLTAIEVGKLEVSMENISLDDVLKQCTSLIQPLADARKLKQIDNISGKGCIIHADFTRLKQVLLNLLSNAVKYNAENGTIILDSEVVDNQRLRISITDSGEGLSEENIDKLFHSFERLNTKFNVEGVGIGLVIAKNLMELMEGTIGVYSKEGKGSTFWLEIGLINEKSIDNVEVPAHEKVILCVDDNLTNLTLIEDILTSTTSYTIISTVDAVTGLELAEGKQPDLILMDINMPVMNGYQVLAELQRNNATRHIPVFAVTGNATQNDIEKGLSAGFKKYITKPIKMKVLIDAINEELASNKEEV